MKKTLTIILALLVFASCKYIDFVSEDKKVAEVGDKVLYETDVKNLIAPGTSVEDSLNMLRQYTNSWALKNLLLMKAEKELSKEDMDVEKELEEYRASLLVFRYEKLYVEQRLDTNISDDECRKYYEAHSPTFTQSSSVVKARIIKISKNSPNNEIIRKMYKSSAIEDIDELERICYSSADRYNNFGNQWTDMESVAREIPLDLQSCEREAWSKSCIETRDSLYNYFVYFAQKVPEDSPAPFEYYKPRIKEIILSKRKQELLSELGSSLIKEAIENKKFKTNIRNKF